MPLKFITLKIVTERENPEEHIRVAIAKTGLDISDYIEEVQ